MGQFAVRPDEGAWTPAQPLASQPEDARPVAPRITADSFRQLTARLKARSIEATPNRETDLARQPLSEVVVSEPIVEDMWPAPPVVESEPILVDGEEAEPAVSEPLPDDYQTQAPAEASLEEEPLEEEHFSKVEAHTAALAAIARLRKSAGQLADDMLARKDDVIIFAAPAEQLEQINPGGAVSSAGLVDPPFTPETKQDVAEIRLASPPPDEASSEPVARRRHPFFPDVFLDDEESGIDPKGAVAPGFVEIASVETETPIPLESLLPVVETSELRPAPYEAVASSGYVEAVEETALGNTTASELIPPVLAAVLADSPPQAVEAVKVSNPEAPQEEQYREDLIADEADAVQHLRGMEVKGIGDIAKAVFSPPTPAERAAFLAEIKAITDTEVPREVLAGDQEIIAGVQPSLRKATPSDDPFAKIDPDTSAHINHNAPDEDSGELARSLLDMMLSNPSAGLPQERALAADALLKLIPKVPTKALVAISDRLSIMENPPHLLIAKLIDDPRIEIAGPLLEQCNHISDQVLEKVISRGQIDLQRLIARRRHISQALADKLVGFEDPSVLLTLIRNSGASISHQSFNRLVSHAARHAAALAPLATRADLPPPIAFELFWLVPAELRRFLLSRFLTDSETLTKILKITKVMEGVNQEEGGNRNHQIEAFMAALAEGNREVAADRLAELAGIEAATAHRIIADRQGEPLAIILKAIGISRAKFGEYLSKLQSSELDLIDQKREALELQNIFDTMSFNKARILLTYWDWATQKHGPYTETV